MLRIYLRKLQLYEKDNITQPIVYSGVNPQSIVATPGTIPNNNWIDFTDDVSDLYKLDLEFSEMFDRDGERAIGSGVQTRSSATLNFEGAAYEFINDWLRNDVAATLNGIEVKIEYKGCCYFTNWNIRHSQITWCEDNACNFTVNLQQTDPLYQCIETTLINDNWQGWFPEDSRVPAGGKKHPRISYCNEIRPNGMLIVQWYLMTTIFATMSMAIGITLTIINPILALIQAIISVVNSLGGNISSNLQPINPSDVLDGWAQYFLESGGCGREHPSPLIRDYISNVCDKCGVIVDDTTAPIFFSPTITLDTSTGQETFANPYYNTVWFNATQSRGIRRHRNLTPFGYGALNTTDYWIPENAPNIALSDFLDLLADVYNAEWRIVGGKLYFNRKDFFKSKSPVYDFRDGATDRNKLVKPICFDYNDIKYPAYVDGLYSLDAGDSCGNEGKPQMNGKSLSFADYENQPNFNGTLNKVVQIGATKFSLDGASTCYYYDALQVVANGGFVTLLSVGFFMPWIMVNWVQVLQAAAQGFEDYGDYALLMKDETATLPKLIVWDGESYENAKAVKTVAAYPGGTQPTPNPNPVYNKNMDAWEVNFYPKTDVIGQNLTFPPSTPGIYEVTDYFGTTIARNRALLVNYPMYFNPLYKDTLWDRFHWIDDPRKNPIFGAKFTALIRLCCEDIQKLGLNNDGEFNKLGELIYIQPSPYYYEGKIEQLTLRFSPEEEYGPHIEIKGTV